jgi:hypothetical protein
LGGTVQGIGPFTKGNVDKITIVGGNGVAKSQPSDLSSDGSNFADAWVSPGPNVPRCAHISVSMLLECTKPRRPVPRKLPPVVGCALSSQFFFSLGIADNYT